MPIYCINKIFKIGIYYFLCFQNAGNREEVVDLKWDKKSAYYLLVAYSSTVSLWDVESGSEVHCFDKQGTGISAVCWMDWTAGSFATSNPRTGVIKVWNVSQRTPLDTLRVTPQAGILGISFVPGSTRAFCACSNGGVLVYTKALPRRWVQKATRAKPPDAGDLGAPLVAAPWPAALSIVEVRLHRAQPSCCG